MAMLRQQGQPRWQSRRVDCAVESVRTLDQSEPDVATGQAEPGPDVIAPGAIWRHKAINAHRSVFRLDRFNAVIARSPEGATKQSRIGTAALVCFASLAMTVQFDWNML
jgi:hypothetical protein